MYSLSLPIQASTAGVGSLSYSASGLPTGLSINSGTGLISGTVDSGVAPGVYTTTLTVSATAAPLISTIAGNGFIVSGDGDSALNAGLGPNGIAVDNAGPFYHVYGGGGVSLYYISSNSYSARVAVAFNR